MSDDNEYGILPLPKIIRNRAQCLSCGDIIESAYRHDFKFCRCNAMAVDGGLDYLKRTGDPDNMIEMSEFEANDDE